MRRNAAQNFVARLKNGYIVAWRGVRGLRGVRGVRGVCGVAWRGVAWRGVAWRGVAWRGGNFFVS